MQVEGTESEQVQRGGFLILERCAQFSVPMQGRIGTRLCPCLSLPITSGLLLILGLISPLLLPSVMEAYPPPPYQSSSAFAYTLVVSAVVVGLVVVAFVASATLLWIFLFSFFLFLLLIVSVLVQRLVLLSFSSGCCCCWGTSCLGGGFVVFRPLLTTSSPHHRRHCLSLPLFPLLLFLWDMLLKCVPRQYTTIRKVDDTPTHPPGIFFPGASRRWRSLQSFCGLMLPGRQCSRYQLPLCLLSHRQPRSERIGQK